MNGSSARPTGAPVIVLDGVSESYRTRNKMGFRRRGREHLALRDLSLTKIESRPLRGKPWEYLFYLDFLGHLDDTVSQKALGHLQEIADFYRVLGCYPRGD